MINSRNDIVSLLKEYIVTQQEYVYQFWMPEAHEWNVKKQVAYYNGIVLGKFREKDAFTLQVLKEGVTDQALYDEIKINLERHIKMIEGLEQPDIMNKMQMESYKRQRDELSRDTIDDWISNYCRWIQEDVMEISYSEIRVLLFIYYSFDNYDYQRKHPFCSDLNELEVVYKGNLDKQNQFFKYGIVPVDDERELLPIEPPRIYDRKINKTFFTKNVPLNLLEKIADMMSSGIVRDFSVRLLNEPGYNGKLYCEYIAEALERGKVFDFVNLGNYSISRLYSKEYENCMWVVIDPQNITFEELCKEFEIYNDMIVTQVVHLQYEMNEECAYITHLDHEYVFYTVDEYENRISKRGEQLYRIGHKLYYDFQINAFLFCKDIYDYSTIHETPEFFYTLSSLNEVTKGIDKKWKKICKSYVVKFTSKLKDFAYFTFYENEREYMDDKQNNWSALRRLLISKAVESAFGDSASQIFAYMKPDTVIAPENIIEYVPAEKWRKDVLKYFGKE